MKKANLFLFALLLTTNLFSQNGDKWFILQDLPDKIVYIDTSGINQTEDMMSVWSMVDYRKAVFSAVAEQDVKRVKTRYLFNVPERTFTVVGAMLYDVTGKLINEPDDAVVTGGNEDVYLSVESGSSIGAIFNAATNYLETGNISAGEDAYISSYREEGDLPKPDLVTDTDSSPEVMTEDTTDSGMPADDNVTEEPALTDTTEETPADTGYVYEYLPDPVVETPPAEVPAISQDESDETAEVPEDTVITETEPVVEENNIKEYDASSERAVTNTIFTDGNTYCFQVSSWKRKHIADKEVQKLIDKGFDAFITEASLPGKGTWYRVRVGYFTSEAEAKMQQKLVK